MIRYVFRFEVLSGLLTGPTVLRPKLLPIVDVKAVRAVTPALRRRASMAAAQADDHAAGWAVLSGEARPMFPFLTPGSLSEAQLAFAASQGHDTLLLRLHLSMTDLTMHHASKVVALTAHRQPVFVRGAQVSAQPRRGRLGWHGIGQTVEEVGKGGGSEANVQIQKATVP